MFDISQVISANIYNMYNIVEKKDIIKKNVLNILPFSHSSLHSKSKQRCFSIIKVRQLAKRYQPTKTSVFPVRMHNSTFVSRSQPIRYVSITTTGATCGAEYTYQWRVHDTCPGFRWGFDLLSL